MQRENVFINAKTWTKPAMSRACHNRQRQWNTLGQCLTLKGQQMQWGTVYRDPWLLLCGSVCICFKHSCMYVSHRSVFGVLVSKSRGLNLDAHPYRGTVMPIGAHFIHSALAAKPFPRKFEVPKPVFTQALSPRHCDVYRTSFYSWWPNLSANHVWYF